MEHLNQLTQQIVVIVGSDYLRALSQRIHQNNQLFRPWMSVPNSAKTEDSSSKKDHILNIPDLPKTVEDLYAMHREKLVRELEEAKSNLERQIVAKDEQAAAKDAQIASLLKEIVMLNSEI